MLACLLLANRRLLDQFLAKDNALVAPFQALLDDSHGHADHTTDHHETLVVEVAHDDNEALVLFTQQVLDWDLDVVELHKGGSSRSRVGGLDLLGLDILIAGNQKNGEALLRATPGDKVVSEHAVGDPFPGFISAGSGKGDEDILCAVNNVMFSIRSLRSGSFQASDITTGKSLSDS